MITVDHFIVFVESHRMLGYAVVFLAMFFEGELFILITGILTRIAALDFFDSLFVIAAGALLGDVGWYLIGRCIGKRYPDNKYIKKVEERVKRILPGIEGNPAHVIFISKFIYGLNHSTIILLGHLRIPFAKFFRTQLVTTFIWALIFLVAGYFFGFAALSFTRRIDHLLIILLAVLIIGFAIEKMLSKKIERKQIK